MDTEKRIFKLFIWKGARYRICSSAYNVIENEIKAQRQSLEDYISKHPDFKSSLVPLELKDNAPLLARVMADAAEKTGVGPMAAVAGAIAESGVKAAIRSGTTEAIIENGGDIYLYSQKEIIVGLYPGGGRLSNTLAFLVKPGSMPLAICSSSSRLGHSASFGDCDLVTVIAGNGALADAAATHICNSVKEIKDLGPVLDKSITIPGISGILIIKDDTIGMIGELPEIVKNRDPDLKNKITHDSSWDL